MVKFGKFLLPIPISVCILLLKVSGYRNKLNKHETVFCFKTRQFLSILSTKLVRPRKTIKWTMQTTREIYISDMTAPELKDREKIPTSTKTP